MCMFIGYPKGMRGRIFYNLKENNVIVSTHATFLEKDYMNNFKPRGKVVLEELDSIRDPQETLNFHKKLLIFHPYFLLMFKERNKYNMYPKVNKNRKQLKTKFKKF